MKRYKSILVLAVLLFSFSVNTINAASGFKETATSYRKNKFVDRFAETTEPQNTPGNGSGWGDPRDDEDSTALGGAPVGDGVGIVLTIGLIYGIYVFERKRKEV
jgi:hypothetical protein